MPPYLYGKAALVEQARYHIAVATIVSRSAENVEAQCPGKPLQQLRRDHCAGIQHEAIGVEWPCLGGEPVRLSHFLRQQNFVHGLPLSRQNMACGSLVVNPAHEIA